MRKCPFCLQEIPEEAKVCRHCSKTVVKRCSACAEEIVATAKVCRFCSTNLEAPPPLKVEATIVPPDAPCGERRDIVMTLVLIFLTCGLYGLIVQYKMGVELNRHKEGMGINPGLDLLLTFLTCGLWVFYLMYRYPKALEDIVESEGGPKLELVVPCILFTFFGLHLVAVLILQGELNKHWELHYASRV